MVRWHIAILLLIYILCTNKTAALLVVHCKNSCVAIDFKYFYELKNSCMNINECNVENNIRERNILDEEHYSASMARRYQFNDDDNGSYRPRRALAQALFEKQRNDRYLRQHDNNKWYEANIEGLNDEMQEKFVKLEYDNETVDFLNRSIDQSTWLWTQIWYLVAKSVLKHFWSSTDINGWLGRGSMLVLTDEQARNLLQIDDDTPQRQSIVDIGAGDGEVSMRITKYFRDRYATEISSKMRNVLTKKGFRILDTEKWWRGRQFDCVSMFNLLDRCSRPVSMLQAARKALTPDGRLVVALVLPFKSYVEANPDHKPEELMPIGGQTFEEQAQSFVMFMNEIGFELVTWSKVPYLCQGDFIQAYYWLSDSVYVFKPCKILFSEVMAFKV